MLRRNKKDIKSRRDYAERLVAVFAEEIQSEHFGGNTSLSIEGFALEYYPEDNNNGNEPVTKGEFHSFLSNESDQNAATTTAHMYELIKYLIKKKLIQQN